MKNVLVFPAGSEIGLEINNALKYSTHFRVFGLTSVEHHCNYVFSDCFLMPEFYYHPGFIDKLNELVDRHEIDYIYPADDDVQLFLVRNQSLIHATVVSPDLFTTEICRAKSKTYQLFAGEDFIPEYYQTVDEITRYPVFLKPDVGQGSQGVCKANNAEEVQRALRDDPNRIICEYLPGEEYTVDCFTDITGSLVDAQLRNRKRIRMGISVCSENLPLPEDIRRIAQKINERLHFKGAWFFQIKRDSTGIPRLMEVAPRIAGTMGLTRNKGTNYPLLTLFTFEGNQVGLIRNRYQIQVDRAFISRYKTDILYDTVYVDFDDTLVVRGKVNTFLMMFLYQAKNEGHSVILLSRHRKDIDQSLRDYHIDRTLFDQILILKPEEKKSDYVTAAQAVFIDDSFAERLDVSRTAGIPVFDCSEVEALVDWRV